MASLGGMFVMDEESKDALDKIAEEYDANEQLEHEQPAVWWELKAHRLNALCARLERDLAFAQQKVAELEAALEQERVNKYAQAATPSVTPLDTYTTSPAAGTLGDSSAGPVYSCSSFYHC